MRNVPFTNGVPVNECENIKSRKCVCMGISLVFVCVCIYLWVWKWDQISPLLAPLFLQFRLIHMNYIKTT